MNETLKQRLGEFMFGKKCSQCQTLGVNCAQVGLLDNQPGEYGQSVIYIDGKAVLRSSEKIADCPAITGENTKEEVVTKLRQTAKVAAGRVTINQIGNY